MRARDFAFVVSGLAMMAYYFNGPKSVTPPPEHKAVARPKVAQAAPATVTEARAPTAVVVPLSPRDTREFREHLDKLRACRDREGACEFPEDDPRSYDFAVGQALKRSLAQMRAWVTSERVEENGVAAIARDFLADPDGHVQEEALKLLATQPTSPENLQAIIDEVLGGYDAGLIDRALQELERYQSISDRDKINDALAQAMITGAPFLAREVSLHIAAFVDARSIAFYADVVEQLPPDSVYQTNLKATLEEFRRKNS